MTNDSASSKIPYENLSLLLYMTMRAISDLKLMKQLFYLRRYQYGMFKFRQMPWYNQGFRTRNDPRSQNYWNYWQTLNSDVRRILKMLPVNPLTLDKNLRKMIVFQNQLDRWGFYESKPKLAINE